MSSLPHPLHSSVADAALAEPSATLFLTETPVDSPGRDDGVRWADRRLDDRYQARPSARAEARRFGARGGPDLADELLDLSETGAQVRLCLPVRPGDRLDVTFWSPAGDWCGRAVAVVRWAVTLGPAAALAGLRLTRRLPARQVRMLAEPN